ncbi:hypothetical protein ACFQY4_32190 [Catellatospora bangladeshensis]|uniref:hypothetical protein n=1 Tax=Catellatospora bangladeshensis TaxID=310355 RepID=UPI00361CB840
MTSSPATIAPARSSPPSRASRIPRRTPRGRVWRVYARSAASPAPLPTSRATTAFDRPSAKQRRRK